MNNKYEKLEGYDVLKLPVSSIYFDTEFNCRGVFTPQSCLELSDSIKSKGLKMPILVQPRVDALGIPEGFDFRLVAGHRRYVATTRLLCWTHIPAMVVEGLTEHDARLLNLIENLERKDLSLMQEAKAIRKTFPDGTHFSEMSEALNKSRSWCRLRWRILDLPEAVQVEISKGIVTASDLTALMYKDPDDMVELVEMLKIAKLHGMSSNRFLQTTRLKRKHKTKKEIDEMLTYLMDKGHYPHPYKALAWAAGRLEDRELFYDDLAQDLQ
jgi:ParB family chromosome partitioning protein